VSIFRLAFQEDNVPPAEVDEELREKHGVIISELKSQLDDLESFAFKQVCFDIATIVRSHIAVDR